MTIAQTNTLRGIAILVLLTHHYSQQDFAFEWKYIFKYTGMLVCAMFFFFSGYGLGLNPKKTAEKGYWTKRFLTIALPFVLANAIYLVYNLATRDSGIGLTDGILYLCGIKLINPHCWFLQMLLILYACFFICRKASINTLLISLIAGGVYIVLTHTVISLSYLTFPAGAVYARKAVDFNKSIWWISLIVFAMSFTYHVYYQGRINNLLLLADIILVLTTFIIIMQRIRIEVKAFEYLGHHSMNFYVIHGHILSIVSTFSSINPYLLITTFFGGSLMAGVGFKKLTAATMSVIKRGTDTCTSKN